MNSFFKKIIAFVLLYPSFGLAKYQVPAIRLKVGKYVTTVQAGNVLTNEELGSLITLQPTVLWALPTFRSRIGLHFTTDMGSSFAFMPIAGLGFSGYFYPFGISSSYEVELNEVVHQKYKFSPYFYGGLTPVNLNLNRTGSSIPGNNFAFSALLVQTTFGLGFDYPFRSNILLSVDINYRFASAPKEEKDFGNIEYQSFGISFSYMTTYF
ncbi:MAG: hypothetical protein D6797_00410 [Bdellovibrio sp.]|nr:MAG: hypothetical protein D6797_00410 [Bdellovibrio sp.]